MSIFLIYSLVLFWGVSNSNVTMKVVQLHYFYHKIFGDKRYCVSSCPNVGGTCPPLNSAPIHNYNCLLFIVITLVTDVHVVLKGMRKESLAEKM